MRPEDYRHLTVKEIDELHARAKTGDEDAVRGFVCFSVWRAILHDTAVPMEQKEEAHETLMRLVVIKVEKWQTNP